MAVTDISFLIYKHLLTIAAVTDLVGQRIKPDIIDPNETLPAIRYEVVRYNPWHNLSTPPSSAQTQLQLDCYGKIRQQANDVAKAVKVNLDGYSGTLGTIRVFDCVLDNAYDRLDPPPPGSKEYRRRRTMDFLISHTEPVSAL